MRGGRALAAAVAAGLACGAAAAAEVPVDLELVLAIDGSASIGDPEFELQVMGHAAAFRSPLVIEAVTGGGTGGRIAVTAVLWSNPRALDVLVPWTLIAGRDDALAFARSLETVPRPARVGSTGIGGAILNAAGLFGDNGFEAPRRTIDLVSNGYSNIGIRPASARDRVVAEGVTVNGLAILDEFSWLADYFAEQVVGGPSAFVRTADGFESFARALLDKLVVEIAALPSGDDAQDAVVVR